MFDLCNGRQRRTAERAETRGKLREVHEAMVLGWQCRQHCWQNRKECSGTATEVPATVVCCCTLAQVVLERLVCILIPLDIRYDIMFPV